MTIKDALREAHHLLRKAVPKARRAFKAEFGPLAQTYEAAMRHWDAQKADGVPILERVVGLEKTLRAAWPVTREWHYVCESCSDSGWQWGECRQGSCGRPFRFPRQRSDEWTGRGRCVDGHPFVQPCFCAKGHVFRQQLQREPTPADAIASAAKTSKPMTRLGR